MANYNVVETTKVSGRCFDFIYNKDIENGSLIAKGDLIDARIVNQNEDAYINVANKPFRAYGLVAHNHDKFAVEDYGINAASTIAVDDYVTVDGTTVKIKDVADSAPTDSTTGFIGKVVEIEDYGFAYCTGTAGNVGKTGKRVVIEVIKNKAV